jgi:cell division protein FtsB
MPLMKNNWFNFILLIALLAGVYFIVTTVREAVNQTAQQANSALQPLSQANQAMQTQVAQLMNPTPTIIPDPVTYITEIRALARLETIQYSVEKVITAEIGQGSFNFLFGDKLLFVAHGTVIAGIDMNKLSPENMRYDGGVLYVTLPPAEVFIATLDNQKSYVYDRETGIFTNGVNDLETMARQSAEQEILKAAMEDGILAQAQINAEAFLLKFFAALGFPNTIFVK